MWKEVVL
jgi:hypothetical protein